MDSTNVYAYISIIALIVCIPPAIIVSVMELPQVVKNRIHVSYLIVFLIYFHNCAV